MPRGRPRSSWTRTRRQPPGTAAILAAPGWTRFRGRPGWPRSQGSGRPSAFEPGLLERPRQNRVRLLRRRQRVVARATLDHEADLDLHIVVVADAVERPEDLHVIAGALARDQELVVRGESAL